MQKPLDLPAGKPWPKNIADYIAAHCNGKTTKQLTELTNVEFGTNITYERMLMYKKNHKLHSGFTGHFKKGAISHNKGLHMEDFMTPETITKFKATQFKKGHTPKNRVSVGTEVVKDDGYLWRKIADPNVWRQVHRLVYEQAHGAIPKGKCVTFLDGNNRNFDINNLVLISMDENRILNHRKLRHTDKDIATAGIALARLESTINQRKGRKSNGYKKYVD